MEHSFTDVQREYIILEAQDVWRIASPRLPIMTVTLGYTICAIERE
jgi:hypothetical protein